MLQRPLTTDAASRFDASRCLSAKPSDTISFSVWKDLSKMNGFVPSLEHSGVFLI